MKIYFDKTSNYGNIEEEWYEDREKAKNDSKTIREKIIIMINLNDYFENVSEFQIIGDMTGWTPSYLNSRNELWYIDPSRNRYMLNYENIENVFDSESIPLYADFLGCDSNDEDEWIEDFKISYKNFKNSDMLKVF